MSFMISGLPIRKRCAFGEARPLSLSITAPASSFMNSFSAAWMMLFMKLDACFVMLSERGLASPKAQRFLIGNPLIMKDMAKHVPEAASYAPVTVLVDERPDAVHLGYDRMASLLATYD